MSSFAQQPRARQQRQRSRSPASCSSRSSSPTRSVDTSAILLFAPPRPTPSPSQSWDVLPSKSHTRALSPASTSASSGTQASASPVTLTRSLFPSHDGNGIFAADSLLLSEQSDASYASPSEQSTSASSTRSHPRTARTRSHARARSPHPAVELGGSWALTEEALSALPDADTPIALGRRHRPASAVDTSSDSSAREDDDEDLLSSTPHAASAGLGWSRWRKVRQAQEGDQDSSAGPYPSPPPLSLARRQKRRHRQEGRGNGSQKRSSASGSAPASVARPPLPIPATTTPTPLAIATKRHESAFFGKLVSKLVDVDSETLDMFHAAASLPTPTPSRSSSPTPSPTPHGLQALASHARSELGFSFARDIDMGGLSDDSGEETETEGARWVHQDHRAVEQPRSHSLTSLPSYFLSPLSPSASTSSVKDAPPLLRRTSSFSGAVLAAAVIEGNAWGGEFEGFEAALSYWRRILRRMRGV